MLIGAADLFSGVGMVLEVWLELIFTLELTERMLQQAEQKLFVK